jgi:penicillin-binding protein 6. Serine peptidase. MEROPS family S11
VPARGYYLIDYQTNQVLAAHNENERLEPASLTKLMTAYAVFHALKDGRIKLDDMVRISAYARSQEGSRMFVEAGSLVSVENLIQGMIVQSGNDATVALAEHVAGSEPVFVDLMNQYALQLGMTSTHFQNSPGMPGPEHYTTARTSRCSRPRSSASTPSTTSGIRSGSSPGTTSRNPTATACSRATRRSTD